MNWCACRITRAPILPIIPVYVGKDPKRLQESYKRKAFNDKWVLGEEEITLDRGHVQYLQAYEELAAKAVQDFQKSSEGGLSSEERLDAAEKVLAAVLIFHDDAVKKSL